MKKNPKTVEERNKFIKGYIVQEAIRKVNKKLNLNDLLTIGININFYVF